MADEDDDIWDDSIDWDSAARLPEAPLQQQVATSTSSFAPATGNPHSSSVSASSASAFPGNNLWGSAGQPSAPGPIQHQRQPQPPPQARLPWNSPPGPGPPHRNLRPPRADAAAASAAPQANVVRHANYSTTFHAQTRTAPRQLPITFFTQHTRGPGGGARDPAAAGAHQQGRGHGHGRPPPHPNQNEREPEEEVVPPKIPPEELLARASSLHPFDGSLITSWVYPTNMPIRHYQFEIVKKAMFENVLVSIPTGFGKTLIAAVVMLNYYRWFPESKIAFVAPTRPLVNQQQEACYRVTGIPPSDTAVMVGTAATPDERRELWATKRVLFTTPQNMQNDLQKGVCPAKDVVLLVVDEAHRSTGNYAYAVIVRELRNHHRDFRVLALSATPGSRREQVQEVVSNLLINRIEIRTEESPDLIPYAFHRQKETVVVSLTGRIKEAQDRFAQFMRPVIQRLTQARALTSSEPEHLSPYLILDSMRRFNQGGGGFNLTHQFMSLHKMVSLAETLATQSVLAFYNALCDLPGEIENGKVKPMRPLVTMLQSAQFKEYLAFLRRHVISDSEFVAHPKQTELERIIVQHFGALVDSGKDVGSSKVIIFAKYREIVEEITKHLSKHAPLVRVTSFVGQAKGRSGSRGLNQREQLAIIKQFQGGGCNTLVSTSVGEEGLDIGEVDLIVCYDASQSPIQMLQRMGRTGRKRAGRIVCLLSAGREEVAYQKSLDKYKAVQAVIRGAQHHLSMHKDVPTILPRDLRPVCIKMRINIPPPHECVGAAGRRGSAKAKRSPSGPYLDSAEMIDYLARFELPYGAAENLQVPTMETAAKGRHRQRPGKFVKASATTERFFNLLEDIRALEGLALKTTQTQEPPPDREVREDSSEIKENAVGHDQFPEDPIPFSAIPLSPIDTNAPIDTNERDDDRRKEPPLPESISNRESCISGIQRTDQGQVDAATACEPPQQMEEDESNVLPDFDGDFAMDIDLNDFDDFDMDPGDNDAVSGHHSHSGGFHHHLIGRPPYTSSRNAQLAPSPACASLSTMAVREPVTVDVDWFPRHFATYIGGRATSSGDLGGPPPVDVAAVRRILSDVLAKSSNSTDPDPDPARQSGEISLAEPSEYSLNQSGAVNKSSSSSSSNSNGTPSIGTPVHPGIVMRATPQSVTSATPSPSPIVRGRRGFITRIPVVSQTQSDAASPPPFKVPRTIRRGAQARRIVTKNGRMAATGKARGPAQRGEFFDLEAEISGSDVSSDENENMADASQGSLAEWINDASPSATQSGAGSAAKMTPDSRHGFYRNAFRQQDSQDDGDPDSPLRLPAFLRRDRVFKSVPLTQGAQYAPDENKYDSQDSFLAPDEDFT